MNKTQERLSSSAVILHLKRLFQPFNRPKKIVEPELMHYQITPPNRTPELLAQIGKVYTHMHSQPLSKYGFAKNYDYHFSSVDISAIEFILNYFSLSQKESISVLDLGTGDISYAQKLKEMLGDAINITVLSPIGRIIKQDDFSQNNITYLVANAEYLFTLFSRNTFDCIVSSDIFNTFVDPIGTINQLYQSLVPNGILLIDDFRVSGIHEQLPSLFTLLNEKGYAIAADYTFGITNGEVSIDSIRCLMLKKTRDLLEIPTLSYCGLETDIIEFTKEHATYQLHPKLQSFKKGFSVNTIAFLKLLNSLLPNLQQAEIEKSIFNIYILNTPFNNLEKDGYAHALRMSCMQLLKKQNVITTIHLGELQNMNNMTEYIGKWIDKLRNKEAFLIDVRERIGLPIAGKL